MPAEIFSVGSSASAASESGSETASTASVGAATAAASSLKPAVVSPDGGGCLLADPGGPGGRLGPLGWWLEDAASPFSRLAKQVVNLGLKHVN